MTNKKSQFTYSQVELKELMGADILPGRLQNTWNSLVVNIQIASLHLMPWHSVARTEFMTRLWQAGDEGFSIYHGDQTNLMPNDLVENTSHIKITTGIGFSRSGCLDIGVARTGTIAVPECIGVTPRGPFFPMKVGQREHRALRIWFDFEDRSAVSLSFSLNDMGKLNVTNPETKEQTDQTLCLIGKAMQKIKDGEELDFVSLKHDLIEKVGLKSTGEIAPELVDSNYSPQRTAEIIPFEPVQ